METYVNLWAVLVSAIANMIVGAVWYAPVVFGKKWLALMGRTATDMETMRKKAGRAYAVQFVAALLLGYVLAHFAYYAGVIDLASGLQLGFWIWLGFVATISLGSVLFENRPFSLYLINVGYWLVSLLVMGSIIGIWQ